MARIVALVPDLLFGSRVHAMLAGAGDEVELTADVERARAGAASADLLVVDLTSADLDGAALVESMRAAGELAGVPALGFYAHIDPDTRRRALAAGFDQVVPRSRMAREGALLARELMAAR